MKIVYIVHAFVNMYKITGEEIECNFDIAYNVYIALSIKDRNRHVRNDHANFVQNFCLTAYIQHLFFLLRCFSIYFNSTNPDVKFLETLCGSQKPHALSEMHAPMPSVQF